MEPTLEGKAQRDFSLEVMALGAVMSAAGCGLMDAFVIVLGLFTWGIGMFGLVLGK